MWENTVTVAALSSTRDRVQHWEKTSHHFLCTCSLLWFISRTDRQFSICILSEIIGSSPMTVSSAATGRKQMLARKCEFTRPRTQRQHDNHFSWSLYFCRDKQVDKKHFLLTYITFNLLCVCVCVYVCVFFCFFFTAEWKGFKAQYFVFLPHVMAPLPSLPRPLFSAPIGWNVWTALAHNTKTNQGLSQDRCGSKSFSENNRRVDGWLTGDHFVYDSACQSAHTGQRRWGLTHVNQRKKLMNDSMCWNKNTTAGCQG